MRNYLFGSGLFVFSDPGGAKPILALIHIYNLTNFRIFSDRKHQFYDDYNVKISICEPNDSEKIIEKYKPDYIFTGTSYTSQIEKKFLFEAKRKNIRSYSFVDHYTRFKERFYINNDFVYPNKIFLTDNKAKKIAEKSGLHQKSELIISGNFHHAYLKKWKPKSKKNYIFPNIDSNQKIILFAPDPLSNIKNEKLFSFDEVDVWKDLSVAINKYLSDINLLIAIKFHPNQNAIFLKRNIEKFPIKNFILFEDCDTNSLIFYSDIIIGMYSSILIESTLLNSNILRHLPISGGYDPLSELGIGKISNSVIDLSQNIRAMI